MNKIFVTGGSGFIGASCLRQILSTDRPYEIYATYRDVEKTFLPDRINWLPIDLTDYDTVAAALMEINPSHLLHLAWPVATGMQLNGSEHYPWVKVSTDLVRSFQKAGGRRVVVSGTCAEYSFNDQICLESKSALDPNTDYGWCKNQLRKWISIFCRKYEVSYGWGRIFSVYGPTEKPSRLISYVIRTMLAGQLVKTTDGQQVHDYLFVDDVASALLSLMDAPDNRVVNISSGIAVKLEDIICKIASKIEGKHTIELGAIPSTSEDMRYMVGDNTYLKKHLDWRQDYSLEQGLEETINAIMKTHPDLCQIS